jgi:hypothetical protein
MAFLLKFPRVVFLISCLALWLAAWIGGRLARRWPHLDEGSRTDFAVVQGATLTLLGLIIGFSFSMAIGRYDQRKTYEEAEANAIGTEYVRADLLPAAGGARVRDLLRRYTDLRISFYTTRSQEDLQKISTDTAMLQNELWAAVTEPATTQPSPVIALAVGGMNDVLNSQGYTQAAWWNRIPEAAWGLMFLIAIFANVLLGYGARSLRPSLFMILPLLVSISFFLISDIDSPRRGIIRVRPQNLEVLRESLR